jgi:hypothetical protein
MRLTVTDIAVTARTIAKAAKIFVFIVDASHRVFSGSILPSVIVSSALGTVYRNIDFRNYYPWSL